MTWPTILPSTSATSESSGTKPSDERIASIIRASRSLPNAAVVTRAMAGWSSARSARSLMCATAAGYSQARA
jgi:hypothetical protein